MYNYLDIGARNGISVGLPPQIKFNTIKSIFNFYGVEPEKNEFNTLLRSKQYINLLDVGMFNTEGEQTLYISNGLGKSSIFPPNLDEISKHYKGNIRDYKTTSKQKIITSTIDISYPNLNFDIIKIDTQGCEYEVLLGGEEHLNNVTALFIETSTVSQYIGQSTESVIDDFLYKKGFINIWRKYRTNLLPIEADNVYLKFEGDEKLVNRFKQWFNLK